MTNTDLTLATRIFTQKNDAPFYAFDGEGITLPHNHYDHRLTLLAASDDRAIDTIESQKALTTQECLDFLLESPEGINIWYYFDYDVCKMLNDIPLARSKSSLRELCKTNVTRWRGYTIEYIPRKIFTVRKNGSCFRSYDIFGFFQCSFVAACDKFGLDTQAILEGKKNRGNFNLWTREQIISYNRNELQLLVLLAEHLRQSLGSHAPKRLWYGPGAVASQWLQKQCHISMGKHRQWNEEMLPAIMHSYFGGRIDVAEIGEIAQCHAYDINSAYPYSMTLIPEIAGWEHAKDFKYDYFGLYHIRWSVPPTTKWPPLPWRSKEGRILYPPVGEGWYFGAEVLAAARAFPKAIDFIEAYYPLRETENFPLRQHILDAYNMRLNLKQCGDAGELAYKLILNSLYGKFAQKVGNKKVEPKWQNYLWAAFTTAYTRSLINDAIRLCPENIISIATDGILCHERISNSSDTYTSRVLGEVQTTDTTERCAFRGGTERSRGLGEWKYEGAAPTILVMPGAYARFTATGTEKYRQRGFPQPFNYGEMLRRWGCDTDFNTEGSCEDFVAYPHFVTFREAQARGLQGFGYFFDDYKSIHNVSLFGFSKRYIAPWDCIKMEGWKTKELLPAQAPHAEFYSHAYAPAEEEKQSLDYDGFLLF